MCFACAQNMFTLSPLKQSGAVHVELKKICLNSANITNVVTIKGHVATEEEIDFLRITKRRKKPLLRLTCSECRSKMENKIIIKRNRKKEKKKNLFTKCLGCLGSKIPNKVCVTMR